MKELTKHRSQRESGVFTQRIWTDNFANVATREKQNLKPINGAVGGGARTHLHTGS